MNSRSPTEIEPTRLKDRIRQATIESILSAAEQVLSEGLSTARMNDIAQRAGVAVGTLYNHFADRDAIVEALMTQRKREMIGRIDEVLDAEGLPFPERLRLLFEVTAAFFVQHLPFYSVYVQCETIKTASHMLPEVYARMEKMVKRGVKEKALRADGADLFPALLMGAMRAVFVRLQILGQNDAQIDPAELTRFFLDGAGA